jgi:DNA uptake protein ComE-like DNA-binding protein
VSLRSRVRAGLVPGLALALTTLHCCALADDPRRAAAPLVCEPAVLVDGALRCAERAPRSLGELCTGAPHGPAIRSGDAIDRGRACAGDGGGHARMDADTLARLRIAVDVNHADADELGSLPGIGPVIAARVIAARPYRSVEELERVRGIGPRTLEKLRPRVIVRE